MDSDEQAEDFDRLFRSTFRRVLAYCLRRLSETAAHDAVSEVYAVAWRKRRRLPDDEHEAALWLLGIARKVVANQTRGQRRWARLLRRVAEQPGPAVSSAETPELSEAMAGLSADKQELLRLAYWDDLSRADMAALYGISVAAVSTRLHRARQELRSRLAAADAHGMKTRDETKVGTHHGKQ
ncbi:RNA polymerase sigma factor [Streptomyces marincola]|uniref:RNA polymerase sigma factor n=1 Tax=Streptomyces marincola TaxID=2878388 RepID=UPI001CF5F2FF|nr:sigma-70 family RNA polymerase sigma factor [Streptomyces marincola]UCM89256.1 sigma-70 family RNA polymerase sigma factor [Streptomyces marincola]